MSRSWKDVKADKARRDTAAGRDMTAARADARARTQAYVLGMSQAKLAASMGISQPRVSQLERDLGHGLGALVGCGLWHLGSCADSGS